MNLLKTGMICLLLSLCTYNTFAQQPTLTRASYSEKPELFHDLPQRMPLNMPALTQLLQRSLGERIMVPLANGFVFTGVVVSKSD
ncbi:MAG TPA: hypothetical protein VM010_03270, partial [Chitinophagaceae bacterium]|nr:hypothetical protein [Chitinophagaceae bacterium]